MTILDDEAVSITNLCLSFDEKKILDGLDLHAKKGEILAILGPSGCGKSSLIKVIAGLLKCQKGDIRLFSNKIAMAFQNGALFTSMTVGENIDLVLSKNSDLSRTRRYSKIEEVLTLVGLADEKDTYPSELSGGMAKRAGIARALSIEPDLMLYDEPSTGLDPVLSSKLDHDLRDINKELGMSTLMVTHDLQTVRTMTDRVALLFEGKIRFLGTAGEFFEGDNEYAVQFRERREDGPMSISNGRR